MKSSINQRSGFNFRSCLWFPWKTCSKNIRVTYSIIIPDAALCNPFTDFLNLCAKVLSDSNTWNTKTLNLNHYLTHFEKLSIKHYSSRFFIIITFYTPADTEDTSSQSLWKKQNVYNFCKETCDSTLGTRGCAFNKYYRLILYMVMFKYNTRSSVVILKKHLN